MMSLLRRLSYLFRRSRRDADLRDEMETHRTLRQARLEREGLSASEAHDASRHALGNRLLAREDARAVWLTPWLESVSQDLRFSARTFARRPLLWSVAVLSLALGIGVNTAAFSLFDQLLLRRLPIPAPEEIVNITATGPRPGSRSTNRAGGLDAVFSHPLFRDLERLDDTGLTGVTASAEFRANLAHDGQSSAGQGLLVSGSYFPVLGVRPALGRLISPADDEAATAGRVVVLSHAMWTTRFGASPDTLYQPLMVNGQSMTIVGVTPREFTGTTTMDEPPDFFVPLTMAEAMRPGWDGMNSREAHWLYLSGRLRAGVSREQAQVLINGPFSSLTREIEAPALGNGLSEQALEQLLARRIVLQDGAHGRSTARDDARTAMLLFAAMAACVLLIACANVGNLMLARVSDRSTEIALRLAIGASSGRLVRWLLTEACLLGVLGGLGAVVVLWLTADTLLAVAPPAGIPLQFEIGPAIWIFALALGCGSGLMLGVLPAIHSVRVAQAAGLQGHGGRTSSPRAVSRYRTALAATQMALATALLAQAGLFFLSLSHIARVDLGLERQGLVMFGVSPYLNGYTPERSRELFDQIEDALGSLPGVQSVSSTTLPLLTGSGFGQNVTVEGFEPGPDADTHASRAAIGADYFRTLGVPVLAGREFTTADTAGAPPVAIVNEAFAQKFRLGREVISRRLALGAGSTVPLDIEIVGLVRDSAYSSVRETPPPQFFLSRRQADSGAPTLYFYVRSESDPLTLVDAIRPTVSRLDSSLPVTNLRTMDDQVWNATGQDRLLATLAATIAGLATLLAGIGLYAVLAHAVASRWREIGIRMALGATTGDIRRSIGTQLGRIAIAGVVVGSATALVLERIGQSFLFGLDGPEPPVLIGAAGVALLVAAAAAIVPARRAGAVNPVEALRAE